MFDICVCWSGVDLMELVIVPMLRRDIGVASVGVAGIRFPLEAHNLTVKA